MPKDNPSVGRRFIRLLPKTLYSLRIEISKEVGSALIIFLLLGSMLTGAIAGLGLQSVAAAANTTVNFQARILQASGALVPDGNYHLEFKIYNASTPDGGETPDQGACTVNSGTADEDCLWVETRSTGNLVRVVNGYVSVYLGDVTAFPSNMPWGDNLYITMRVGGTSGPSWDTEMINGTTGRMKLSAVPYAFTASNLSTSNTNSASSNSSNISIQTGNAAGATSNSGNVSIDVGTATGTAGTISVATTNASALLLGRTGLTAAIQGGVSVAEAAALNGDVTIGNASTDLLTISSTIQGSNALVFEGATADGFETTISVQDPTADVTLRLPALAAGTYDFCTSSGNCLGNGDILQGGNSYATAVTIGTNDAYDLNFETNGTTRITVDDTTGNVNFTGSVVLAASQSLTVTGGNTASRPASPTEGMVYYDTTTKQLLTYANGKWQGDRTTATKIVAASNSSQSAKDGADYVADGNTGAANDGDQIQINQALAAVNTLGGGTVFLSEGTYVVDATIAVPSNITLIGTGNSTIITLPNSLNTNIAVVSNDDSTNGNDYISIRNILIDGNKSAQSSGTMTGISIAGGTINEGHNSIIGVTIRNMRSSAIIMYGQSAYATQIADSLLANNNFGIELYDAYYSKIVNNSTLNNVTGIYNSTSDYSVIEGNIVSGNTGNGIEFESNYLQIAHNEIASNGTYGIMGNGGLSYSIDANTIYNNGSDGINSFTSNSTISNNVFLNNGGSTANNAISIYTSDYNSITNNLITDTSCTSTCYAINISNSTSDKNYLSGNRYTGSAANAATINDSGTNTIYEGQQVNSTTSTNSDVSDIRFRGSANSTTAFSVQKANGASILNVDTSNGEVELGNTTTAGKLVVSDGSSNTATLVFATSSADVTFQLPAASAGTYDICTTASVCSGYVSSSAGFIQNGNSFTANAVLGTNDSFSLILETANTTALTIDTSQNVTLAGDLAVNGDDITSDGDLTITPAGGDTTITGTLTATGLLTGQAGATISGATTSINDSSNFNTNINTGTSTGTIAIGNSVSTTTILGVTTINTTGTATTGIGNSGAVLTLSGSSILLNSATLQRTAAGTTSLDFVDGSNTTLALLNSGAGVANLTVDGAITVATLGSADTSTFLCRNAGNQIATCSSTPLTNSLTDNITDAFDLQEGTNNYININTTNASENISFGNATTNPSYNFLGTGTLTVAGASTFNSSLTTKGQILADGTGSNQTQLIVRANSGQTVANPLVLLQDSSAVELARINASATSLYFGNAAGGSSAAGGNNTGIGASALGSISTGTGNTTLGSGALASVSGNNNNTAVGYNAGNLATGGNNIFLGALAGDNVTTGTDNIIIGYNLDASAAGVSNELRIGGVLQGNTSTLAAQFNGALTVTGLTTLNGGLTVEAGDTFTFNGDAFTDLTGTGLTLSGGALTVDNTVLDNSFFIQNGNSFGATAVLGTNDAFGLSFETGGNTQATIADGGATTYQNSTNSTSAFRVLTSASTQVFGVDTSNRWINVGQANSVLGRMVFYGDTGGNDITLVGQTAPAGNRTITLPDANGTICLQNSTSCGFALTSLTDNTTDALDFQEGTNNYININTTNASENISFGNATTNPSYSFLGSGTLSVAGATTITGLTTLNGGLTVEAGDTFTFNSDAFTDLTGSGLVVSSNALTLDITSATGAFINGGNSFAGTATLGTNDANILSLETTNTSRFQIAAASATLTGQGATTLTSTAALSLSSAAASNIDITTGTTGALTLDTGSTGTINLGVNANAKTINIGTGAAVVQTINIGGTGDNVIALGNTQTGGSISIGAALTTGTISIGGTGAQTGTISLGTGTGAQTINLATGAGAKTTSLGSTNTTSTTTLNAGSGYLNFNATQAQFTEVTGTRTLTVQTRTTAATAGSSLTVQAGSAATSGVAATGGTLTLQGGSANGASAAANGGNVVIAGGTGYGTGVKGLVVIDTATYSTASLQSSLTSTGVTQANVDTYGGILLQATGSGVTFTLPDPTQTTTGRVIYVTNAGSNDFTLAANTVGTSLSITLKPSSTATMYWNGTDWTAAGASSSTDLQAAYDNTATSAGGAEIVLSSTGTGGLTIRNDDATAITGGLLEVQTSIGSNLFTVNNNATEYASNGGAESATFTAWAAAPAGGTVTRYTTIGDNIATGVGSTFANTTSTANTGVKNTLSASLTANLKYKVSYTARHTSSTATFTTLETYYSNDGTTAHMECGSDATIYYNKWTRVDCTFTPTSVGASNAIIFRHTDAVEHDFYIDNFSVTVDASSNHAVDGDVDSALGTNWQAYDADGGAGTSTPTRDTTNIYNTSGAVAVATAGPAANLGVRNNMSITPSVSTQYLVTFYAKLASGSFTDITVGFLPAGGSSTPNANQLCTDYNTQTLSTSAWTKITCIVTTPSSGISDPDLVIYQPTSGARTFYVDALSITLNTNNSSNVQVGGGQKGGPTTLFTLDRSYGAPIADNNDAYLGSMYYDTSTGRIQCYEADGWGACGAAPDNIVNLNPEYAGAVLNGSGVGTMTADFCSDDTALTVNASLCETGQAKNYYKWTSPQATQQTYSIYVTYQLPSTFNGFSSDDTVQLTARVDNTTNASVTYEMFKSTGSAVTQCGTGETNVITGGGGSANTWYTYGVNGNEATGCSFSSSSASNFVIFKINMKANSNATAYVSTLSFTTTGR